MRSVISCLLLTTVTQLLFDFNKHALAHVLPFSPFLAPFLLMLTTLCFLDPNICRFFIHIRKHMMGKKL